MIASFVRVNTDLFRPGITLPPPYEYPARYWELDDAVDGLAGRIPILTARMNADPDMADDLKYIGKGRFSELGNGRDP